MSQSPEKSQEQYRALNRLRAARRSGSAGLLRRAEQTVTLRYLSMADALARRYRGRGAALEDLTQLARLALVEAVKRWDPKAGDFPGFAVPTITGSIKRYFRDHLYLVRIPRDLQEVNRAADLAGAELEQRSPRRRLSTAELAATIGATPDRLRAARAARGASRPAELEDVTAAVTDTRLARAEIRADLSAAFRGLTFPERRILRLYYVAGWSQTRIARLLGVSQMQVSRLHSSIVAKLRRQMMAS